MNPSIKNNYISMSHNQIATLNINQNEGKPPLENITLNWLSGSNCFKGREHTLTEIKEMFETKKRVVVHGAPGIGKTEVARHFAENNSEDFNGNLIWVYAETAQNIQNCFGELAASLELKTSDVSQVYSKFRKSRCLVIFDNAENMAALGHFLPSEKVHSTVCVLITSQFGEWDASVGKKYIDALKPEDALNILSEKLGDTYNKKPQEIWYELVQRLECIPLSVKVVSSLLYQKFRIGNFNLNDFINDLMDGTFINSKFPLSEQNLYNKTVLSSIYSALNRLQMKEALDLLCFIAYLDADCIYHDDLLLVPSIKKSNDKLQEALIKLEDYSLIQFEFEEITIHRTIQLVLRKYDLNELNGIFFKTILNITFDDLLFLHMSSIYKYANMEEYQEKSIEFYDENANKVDLFLFCLGRNHCDKILEVLLPKFKHKFNKSDVYNKILNKTLLEALRSQNTDIRTIDVLINFGAKITYTTDYNWTNGFHRASSWLSIELFDRLLESNDSKNIINNKDQWGKTILHLLVENSEKSNIAKTIKCMDHLISKWNADISIRHNYLNNILHTACTNYNICLEMIKYLVEKCNCKHLVNTQNENGYTPLQLLSSYNTVNFDLFEIVSYLINECGVDTTIQNKNR